MTPPWYRAAWALARPFAPLASAGRGKFARSVRGRRGAPAALERWAAAHRDPARPLVWLHAASVGEGRQAEAVLRLLRAARPGWQFVYTHSSPSAEAFAAALPADFAGYVPFDTARETGRALDAARPSLLCFAATDVWPELVHQAVRRGAPTALVSANLAAASSRLGAAARALRGPAYAELDRVGAIDAADAERLVALGARPGSVVVTGDTRHDAALARAAALDRGASHLAALTRAGGDGPIVVAGSTWPSDDARLLPALGALRRTGGRVPFRLVVAPHEPTPAHRRALAEGVAAAFPGAAEVVLLSDLEARAREGAPAPHWDVCVVDRVGVLAELYAAAAVAYVGGGFHRHGLHSVIEPAALGVPVLFGPRWRMSRDARLLLDAGGGAAAADERGLEAALRAWLGNGTARATAGAAARAVVERGRGAAERSVGLLLDLLEPPASQPTA
jgi:3-deoxy-D-manno-octulosonic-acid transferase